MDILSRNDRSPFGRLDVRIKLAIGFSMSILAVLVDSLPALSSLAALSTALFLLSRPNRSQLKLVSFVSVFLVWGVMLSQSLFYNHFPRDAVVTIVEPNALFHDGLRFYAQGLHYGAVQSFRMLAVGFCGYAVCFSTEPEDFIKGLTALKVPFSLAFIAVSAIQLIPVFTEAFLQTRMAMRLRGYRPFRRGFRQTVRAELGGIRSVLAGTIRRSEEKALSILTRGFDITGRRTSLHDDRLNVGERLAVVGLVSAVLCLSAAKAMFWLYQQQIWSAPELREFYGFVREWL